MENGKDRRQLIVLTVITVATFLTAMIGATFAYFTAQVSGSAQTPITVTTSTSDSLVFGSWPAILIEANQTNFAQGLGDQVGTTGGSVTLTASTAVDENGNDITAEYCYTAELQVTTNTLIYTTAVVDDNDTPANADDDTYDTTNAEPELVITAVKTPQGGSETTLLDEVDITTIANNGFIQKTLAYQNAQTDEQAAMLSNVLKIPTTTNGTEYVHKLSATSGQTAIDTWNITVTLVNLDSDQNENAGDSFGAMLVYTNVECPSVEAGD
ncbi:MAG: hypothetical protein E7172_00160 [Firmicutes bacterium]|nr:hypothetical protein [Bacillota bacterium]